MPSSKERTENTPHEKHTRAIELIDFMSSKNHDLVDYELIQAGNSIRVRRATKIDPDTNEHFQGGERILSESTFDKIDNYIAVILPTLDGNPELGLKILKAMNTLGKARVNLSKSNNNNLLPAKPLI